MDSLERPRRPVVPSQLAAQESADSWTRAHDYRTVTDGDGLVWDVRYDTREVPSTRNQAESLWQVRLHVRVAVSAEDLVRTGTLSAEDDARLVALIGAETVQIALRPIDFDAFDRESIASVVTARIVEMRREFAGKSLRDVKRGLVARWIDRSREFAHTPAIPAADGAEKES